MDSLFDQSQWEESTAVMERRVVAAPELQAEASAKAGSESFTMGSRHISESLGVSRDEPLTQSQSLSGTKRIFS